MAQGATPDGWRVRFVRTPLGRAPTTQQVVDAIAGGRHPVLLGGRWGLPADAPGDARVMIAAVDPDPDRLDASDPMAVFDVLPTLVGGAAPAGAVGGGCFGWLGYDLGRGVERTLGPQPHRPSPLPAAHLAWYADVLRRDADGTWWVEALLDVDGDGEAFRDAVDAIAAIRERWIGRLDAPGAATAGARLGAVRAHRGVDAHRAAIAETVERIGAGELFQANVCLRLETDLEGEAAGLVAPVLEATDPWYGAWLDAGAGRAIVSASPELFLRRRGRDVVTGPIKGTAPRPAQATAAETDATAEALVRSPKDHAEHVMIVDLMRNDLGRVSDYGSIWWDDTPRLEPHAGVWHLVSQVGGRLHEGLGDRDLLRATFPPGSVTGAPKVQAMRVIAAVEGTGREAYTGAHGFSSPVAGLELAVTIRTIELSGRQAWIGVGGGIVADSRPGAELNEALGKATALVTAAGGRLELPAAPAGGAGADGAPWIRSADARPDPAAGLLETLRVEDGRALQLDGHLDRLRASLAALGHPPAPDDLRDRVAALAATAVAPARIRLLATLPGRASAQGDAAGQDIAANGLTIELQLVPIMATGIGTGPVALAPAVWPGGVGPHKFLDRGLIDALTARLGATPLLLDAGGAVLEAGWANVWWIDDAGLATTPLDGRILPGVTRASLLARGHEAPLPVREATIRMAELATLPLLLTSARGVSVGRLATTPPAALERATALAAALAPLVSEPG